MLSLLFLSLLGAQDVVQKPVACLEKKQSPCKIMAEDNTKIQWKKTVLYLKPSSVVELQGDAVHLYKGSLLVTNQAKIETAFASFQCDDCHLDIKLSEDKVLVKNLEGLAHYKTPDKDSWEKYPRYFENEIYKVNPISGKAEESIFSVLSIEDYKRSYGVHADLKKILNEKKDYYSKILRDQRFLNSQIIKQSIERKIAAQQEIERRRALKRQERKQEREKYRKMYRQRYFYDEAF